jgi:pyruvate dehydrogenase E2 component (dihydrolipoamide acetyltransferase)
VTDFLMPSLGADMEDGKLVQWLVKPGDSIHKGDIVAVVETHKGAIDVEIFEQGAVEELCVAEGDTVPVGAVLARVRTSREPMAEQPAPPPSPVAPPAHKVPPPLRPASPEQMAVRKKVSPAARQLAASLGMDPDRLSGTGVDGAVTFADVELARARGSRQAAVAAPQEKRGGFDPGEMRHAIAAAMSRSKREIPHYYLSITIDMTRGLGWLAAFNAKRPPDERMLPAVLLLKATALALRKAPQLNGFWRDDGFRAAAGIHIGWAISLRGGGLVAPAIHDVDGLSLPDVMGKLRDLVARARLGGLRSSELGDPTVTITSLGERGADAVTGVIHPPQVAIVGFGRIGTRPWVVDGKVEPRSLIEVTLAADHRASDGHAGGLFLSALDQLLQEPEKL